MPPDTGGRGSYGHRHPGQEEVYFVISRTVTFKVGDDVFGAAPQSAGRVQTKHARLSPAVERVRTLKAQLEPEQNAGGPPPSASGEPPATRR
jgi:hypothetical protein